MADYNKGSVYPEQIIGQSATDKVGFHGADPTAQAAAISDITVSGTYATDDEAIQTAVNGVLAVMRAKGWIAAS